MSYGFNKKAGTLLINFELEIKNIYKIYFLKFSNPISHPIYLILNSSEHITFQPREIFLNGSNITDVTITGVAATSETFLEITECTLIGSENPCPFKFGSAKMHTN